MEIVKFLWEKLGWLVYVYVGFLVLLVLAVIATVVYTFKHQ